MIQIRGVNRESHFDINIQTRGVRQGESSKVSQTRRVRQGESDKESQKRRVRKGESEKESPTK